MRLASELETDRALSYCNADAVKHTLEEFIDNNTISQEEITMMHNITDLARDVERVINGVISRESSHNVIPFDNSVL